MPSTVLHVAFALLLAAGLLGDRFDRRAAVVVAAATVFPDLDVFVALVVESAHRAAFHTLLLPGAAALAVWWETRRETSRLHDRYGADGVRLVWVALVCYVVAGIGLDTFTALGANPLYPFYDQFVEIDGTAGYVVGDGLYQTFVTVTTDSAAEAGGSAGGGTGDGGALAVDVGQQGSTDEIHVSSGVDPERGPEPRGVERVFPVVYRGWHVTLMLAGGLATWWRLRESDGAGTHSDER
jgi:inner membrane protein